MASSITVLCEPYQIIVVWPQLVLAPSLAAYIHHGQ